MPQRKYTKTKEQTRKPSKRITIAIDVEEYKEIVTDPKAFRTWVDENIARSPELFPSAIAEGYQLHSIRDSVKMPGITLRRIELKTS